MTGDIFIGWLNKLNADMKRKRRNILLIIDNAACHKLPPTISNVKVHFLPPNCTSKLQPCDAGIIRSFKAHYRAKLLTYWIQGMENGDNKKVDLKLAMGWIGSAWWLSVTSDCIKNCWRNTGIVPSALDAPLDVSEADPVNEVARLLLSIATPNKMNADEYVDLDAHEAAVEELSDKEIAVAVYGSKNEIKDDDDENDDDGNGETESKSEEARVSLTDIDMLREAQSGVAAIRKLLENDPQTTIAVSYGLEQVSVYIQNRRAARLVQTSLDSMFNQD